jgi:stage IV sporulation protein FB
MHNSPEENINLQKVNEDTIQPLITLQSYPPKPLPENIPKKNSTARFIVSILLFATFYYFFISKNLEIIIWLAIIVLIHELGHYFAMKIFHYDDLSIFFIPLLGAIAGGNKEKIFQKEKAIVLLAGPVPGIVIGIIIFLIASHFENYSLLRLSYAFVLINVLNLLPIYPLDGGQLLKTLFLDSRQLITNIFVIVSIVVLATYAVSGEEWFLLVIPYFLVTRMVQEWRLNKLRKTLDQLRINYRKSYAELTDSEYWQIRELAVRENRQLSKYNIPDEHIVSENESEVISYIKSILKIKPIKDLSITGIILFLIIWIAAIAVPLVLMTRIWLMI